MSELEAQTESNTSQGEVFPRFRSTVFEQLPQDLYIPPDALEVFLDAFEGPLDLLLYLIRKTNMDILDIPIADITRQYVEYVDMMKGLRFELAADYLVMAAILAEIKSRMLLPRAATIEGLEEDPRADLIRRLQEYERFKNAAENLDMMPRIDREIYTAQADIPDLQQHKPLPDVQLQELFSALMEVLKRVELNAVHEIEKEPLSVRERMSIILSRLEGQAFVSFSQFFNYREGKLGVVVTFIAMLELLKQSLIDIVQNESFSPIYVKAVENAE